MVMKLLEHFMKKNCTKQIKKNLGLGNSNEEKQQLEFIQKLD